MAKLKSVNCNIEIEMLEYNNEKVDVLIRTFNSAITLERCLRSITEYIPYSRIIIADHNSTDNTQEIARTFNAEILTEEVGLGFATKLLISKARANYILFVDGDIEIVKQGFVEESLKKLKSDKIGAVVGCALGHRFLYGIPLGLTLMHLDTAKKASPPDQIQGRETYYFEEALRMNSLKIAYIRDAMVHRSTYRNFKYWPEWQGAQIRLTPSRHVVQLINAITVVFMMHLNSKKIKNFFYSPIYYIKILRGYFNPIKFGSVDRRKVEVNKQL